MVPSDRSRRLSYSLQLLVTGVLGFVICLLYETGNAVPLPWILTLAAMVFFVGFFGGGENRYWLLPRWCLILYGLPFFLLVEYLQPENVIGQKIVWGLTANPYEQDLNLITLVGMVGFVGVAGLVVGLLIGQEKASDSYGDFVRPAPYFIGFAGYLFLGFLSILFAWMSAPVATFLTAAYTMSASPLESAGIVFGAAWMLAHVLCLVLFLDMLDEADCDRRKWKSLMFWSVFFLDVIWFQFLRGDREAIGLLVAMGAVFVVRKHELKIKHAIILSAGLFVVLQAIGSLRSQPSEGAASIPITYGTWSAVLLTPLSIVGDDYFGLFEPRWGQTYVDYALSLPPSFIAQAFGWKRRISGDRGPAWEMRYGIGGTHAMVVPFMNFRTPGVFLILALYGFFLAKLEGAARRNSTTPVLLLYGSVFIATPFWFWYGEMSFVRCLMSYIVVLAIYWLLPKRGCLSDGIE